MEGGTKADISAHNTRLAKMVHSYGGIVEMESAPGIWITVHNPTFTEGYNFRPKSA